MVIAARPVALLALVAAGGCAFPRFVARKTVHAVLPLDSIQALQCTSHNGDIVCSGQAGLAEIHMRVDMSVRGHTQAEADENLDLLSVRNEQVGDRLEVQGEFDPARLRNMSPAFSFTFEVPPELRLGLESHNGDLEVRGVDGAIACETHNGDVTVHGQPNTIALSTHNGDIDAGLEASGKLDGSLVSHNGNIHFAPGRAADATLTADTHNGRIRLEREATHSSIRRQHMQCRLGEGSGAVEITTHNGDIVVR